MQFFLTCSLSHSISSVYKISKYLLSLKTVLWVPKISPGGLKLIVLGEKNQFLANAYTFAHISCPLPNPIETIMLKLHYTTNYVYDINMGLPSKSPEVLQAEFHISSSPPTYHARTFLGHVFIVVRNIRIKSYK